MVQAGDDQIRCSGAGIADATGIQARNRVVGLTLDFGFGGRLGGGFGHEVEERVKSILATVVWSN